MNLLNKKNNKKRNTNEKSKKKTIKRKDKVSFLKKEDTYTNKDILTVTISSIIFGFVFCLFTLMFITGGKNIVTLCTELKDFIQAYNILNEKYYGEIDKKELINGAINGMYSSVGDDYTTYINKDDSENFEELIEGEYEGIGCTVLTDKDNNIVVYNIFENSPAAQAGLKEGDIIIKVDGEDYTTKNSAELASYIKSNSNPKVTLTIKREEEIMEITIIREKIEIPSVSTKTYEKNDKLIGYIQISSFSSVTKKQFETKLKELEKNNIDSLIIDVRNNGGGYLDCVTDIASLFLEKGKVIYQLETSESVEKITSNTKVSRDYSIVVLVNKGSASASEILAASLKESYGSHVVGTNTYGKGTVQETVTMKDGSIIKYTTKKWLTPSGEWINGVGLEPTDKVELTEEYYSNPTEENDNQLQRALEILSN